MDSTLNNFEDFNILSAPKGRGTAMRQAEQPSRQLLKRLKKRFGGKND